MINNRLRITILAFTLLLPSCHTTKNKEAMTRRLFMQSREISIELPPRENILSGDEEGGAFTVGERVDFVNEDVRSEIIETEEAEKTQSSIEDMQYIDDVVVTASYLQRFTPERDGYIDIDFIVKVPKEFVSSEWRLSLQPQVMLADTTVSLESIILKGKQFLDKQEADKETYAAYVSSIVSEEDYDNVFLDRAGIARDLARRQQIYYNMYNQRFRQVEKYLSWRQMIQERYDKANTLQEGRKKKLYHNYMLNGKYEALRLWALGKDSTGTVAAYERKYNRRVNFWPQYKIKRELTLSSVPKKYRGFYQENTRPGDVGNYTTTANDSIQLAEHHYLFGAIAENELKEKRRSEMEINMVPFPFETDTRFVSVGEQERDFIYYYNQPWPVTPGLEKMKITLQGKIDAVDLSSFTLPPTDTLTYLISSLAELADTTLTEKRTTVYRNMIARETIYPKFPPNRTEFNIGEGDNRSQVDKLTQSYNRYTTERGLALDSVRITSTTALDGSYNNNVRLSQNRVEAFSNYLSRNHGSSFPEYKIRTSYRGEDWNKLIELLGQREDLSNKSQILAMLNRGKSNPDETEQEIKQLYRADYKIIHDSIYPLLSKMDVVFFLSRPGMIEADSIHTEVKEGYAEGLALLQNRQYQEALQILQQYPDYNTALCLTALGYHGQAFDILMKESPNGNTEYLLAIVCSRLNRDLEARDHLLKALELDPAKSLRAVVDTETASLIRRYNLQEKIREAEWRWIYDFEE